MSLYAVSRQGTTTFGPVSTAPWSPRPIRRRCCRPARCDVSSTAQARWWFKYGLQLPERTNSSLALGLAVHQALEVNFREKFETREDLETTGVVTVFRDAWMEQVPGTEFTADESQEDLRRLGERLVAKYMDEVAPKVEPAAVELDVQGEISGVKVRGRVDVLDVEGRLIDFQDRIPPAFLSRPTTPFNSPPTGRSVPARTAKCASTAW